MRIVYIDESYDRKTYVLCGVLIVDMKYRIFSEAFNKLLKNVCHLNEDEELKGDWLFNGRSLFKKYNLNERSEMALKISEFIGQSNISKLIIGYKTNYKSAEEAYLKILDFLISRSAKLTSKAGITSKQLMIIFDEREKKMENKIYETLMDKRKEIVKKYRSSCAFFDYGYGSVSRYSRMLQLADFIAYFMRNFLSTPSANNLFEKKADERKIRLLANFRENIRSKLIISEVRLWPFI
jgi:hypothetical protein